MKHVSPVSLVAKTSRQTPQTRKSTNRKMTTPPCNHLDPTEWVVARAPDQRGWIVVHCRHCLRFLGRRPEAFQLDRPAPPLRPGSAKLIGRHGHSNRDHRDDRRQGRLGAADDPASQGPQNSLACSRREGRQHPADARPQRAATRTVCKSAAVERRSSRLTRRARRRKSCTTLRVTATGLRARCLPARTFRVLPERRIQ